MKPKKGGLQDKLNAAMERMNAGRQAKLTAKSEVAANQGNMKKAAKLEMRSKKVALRSEKRQAISDAKKAMTPMSESRKFDVQRIDRMIPPPVDINFQSNEMRNMKNDLNMYKSKNK
jgi:hypothetical protein